MNNMRTLYLPGGGTISVPLPGTDGPLSVRQGALASAQDCPRLVPTVLVSLVVGAAIGATVMAWVQRSR